MKHLDDDRPKLRDFNEKQKLQEIFNTRNTPQILVFLDNLIQLKLRGLLQQFYPKSDIYISVFKILQKQLKLKFYGANYFLQKTVNCSQKYREFIEVAMQEI